ncbi:MAG: ABC transporter ATP-binding protein [Armatimonadetes bacterium]|nr:ABC transporter ATP-binding protein [Armatimonadota bacterium]
MVIEIADPVRRALPLKDGEEVAFALETDLLTNGRYGESWLVATGDRVWRVERPPGSAGVDGRPQIGAAWAMEDLSEFSYEELVDAGSIVAKLGGRTVELVRGTAPHGPQMAMAAKQLNLLQADGDAPPFVEGRRVCPKCKRPLPKDSDVCEGCLNRGQTLLRVLRFLKPYRAYVAVSALLLVLGLGLTLAPPYIGKLIVDRVLTPGDRTGLFVTLIGALVGAWALLTVIQIIRFWMSAWLGNRVIVDIRRQLFAHLQALSLGYYDRRTLGSVMSRMTNDTGALYEVLVDGIPFILSEGLLLIGIPIMLFMINWQVAVWTLLPVPIILFLVRRFRRRIFRIWRRYWHSWSRLSGALSGVLGGMRIVKAFRGEQSEIDRFGRRIRELADTGYAAETAWATFFPIIVFLVSVGTAVVWYVGGIAVLNNAMTLGDLLAFITYLALMQRPLQVLTRLIDWTSRGLTAAERVFEVLDTIPAIQQPKDPVHLGEYVGNVRFENVQFGYERAHEVLHDISFEVKPGEMIGIVGPSGSGKTTLVNLLLRFYDPSEGSVTIDGVDLRELDLDELRRNLGVVPQESYLFPGSVRHNIAYGRPEASLEEVVLAAKAANAHDFIAKFPDGYDSYVGERGQRLSGGERQRIAIARAILHNPKILILDEATSSVDTEAERMIQEAIAKLVEGRTVFVIAHRLSTLRNADRILVMNEGRIEEMGTHDELMKQEGIYHKFLTMQQELAKVRADYFEFAGVEA